MWQLNAIELCLTDSVNLIAHQSKSVKKNFVNLMIDHVQRT